MPGADIEKHYQDRYTLAPPSRRGLNADSVVHFAAAVYTWLCIGQARSIEATWPRGYDCAVPRQRLQEPERVLCQLLREKKLDIVEKNDVGIFCSDHVVKDTRDTGCPLAMR